MRKITIILSFFFLTVSVGTAQEIKWMSFEEALALQKKKPKKIIMDVYTSWCGFCKRLDKGTFKNKDVVKFINKHYYAVKFNGEGNKTIVYNNKTYTNPHYNPAKANSKNSSHQLTTSLKVNAYPTIVFFKEDGKLISPIPGYKKPQQLELYLKLFQTDKYLEMKTQNQFNAYYASFTPEFSE